MRRLVILVALAVFLLATSACADVLWDQTDYDAFGPGFFNSESGSPPFGMTNHCVNHITVGGGGWMMESISTYYSALDPAWGETILEGYLHIFDKTGPLPIDGSDDPTISPLVPMTAVLDVDHIVVTASALGIELTPGEYWIGITPVAPSGGFGPEIHLAAMTAIGDASASYDAYGMPMPMWMNFNPGVDASILIEGNESVPTYDGSWGSVKALY